MMWRPTAHIYAIQSGLFIKVGRTRDLESRFFQYQLHNPHPCKIVAKRSVDPDYAGIAEKRAHEILREYSIGREWFMISVKPVRSAMAVAVNEAFNKCMADSGHPAWAQIGRRRKAGI
jgi:hypothetical protein